MKPQLTLSPLRLIAFAGALFAVASTYGQKDPVTIDVDATDAPRKVLHAKLQIPAQAGKLTLLYPKWIPGEHGPTGPVTDLVGLRMSAAGKPVIWQRDPVDMHAFHLEVPAEASVVEVALDFLSPPPSDGFSSGASATAQLVAISWNQLLLYPKGAKASDIQYRPRLRLPERWKFGTALPLDKASRNTFEFSPVSLETLVDSPLIAGAHFRTVDLSPGATPSHKLHMAADSREALEIKPEDVGRFSQLVLEAGALFGSRHYRGYHFLLTLKEDGGIADVIPGLPAEKAGISASMKLIAVNDRRWTPTILREAIKSTATSTVPITLLVENEGYFKTYSVDYRGGEKYPILERDETKVDLLAEIRKPLAQAAKSK